MSEPKTFSITLVKEQTIEIAEGQSILEASLNAGIHHYHVCGGNGKCSTCRVLVLEGAENLSPPNSREQKLRDKTGFPANIRLACQTKVTGEPVVLNRIVRDETDLDIYSDPNLNEKKHQIGEEKHMALMFLDIRNFTPFMERHLAFDVIHIISKLFHIFQETINASKGQIIETAGDGLYAVFGLQNNNGNCVENAVRGAYALLNDIELFNQNYLTPYFGHSFEIGIGLHYGNVIYGTLNRDFPSHMVVMGYPVNIAARLQAATKTLNNSLVASEHIVSNLENPIPDYSKVQINLKGVSKPLTVFLMGKQFQQPVDQY